MKIAWPSVTLGVRLGARVYLCERESLTETGNGGKCAENVGRNANSRERVLPAVSVNRCVGIVRSGSLSSPCGTLFVTYLSKSSKR